MRTRYVAIFLLVTIAFAAWNPAMITLPTVMEKDNPPMNRLNIPTSYIESSPFSINGNSDFADKASTNMWPGDGSSLNPYVISNLNITSISNITTLVSVSNTDVHFRIEGSLFVGGSTGIRFADVTHGIVFNNSIQDCYLYGCTISDSNLTRFENNTIRNIREIGVGLFWTDSHNGMINGNAIEGDCDRGILMDYSTNCSITHNNLSGHTVCGMTIRDSDGNRIHGNLVHDNDYTGISLGNANYCNITDNWIFRNNRYGLDAQYSSYTLIQNNLVYDQSNSGISLNGPFSTIRNNTFYNSSRLAIELSAGGVNIVFNNFIDNGNGEMVDQVQDSGSSNYYDRNYWSDLTWPDADGDMIVDTVRYILVDAFDQHPVTTPYIDHRLHVLSRPKIIIPDVSPGNLHTSCNVTWNPVGDTFGHAVQYSLDYSADRITWIEIVSEPSTTHFFWNLTSYPDRTNVTFRVTATCTDGLSNVGYSTTHMVIEHTIRELRIFSPVSGNWYHHEMAIMWDDNGCTLGHHVSYTLFYSSNGGNTWNHITEGLMGKSFVWGFDDKPYGSDYLIKVIAECSGGVIVKAISNSTFGINSTSGINSTEDLPDSNIYVPMLGIGISVILVAIYILFRKRRN